MGSLCFEWDENKAKSNKKKHGITFDEAKTAFSDDFGCLIPDPDSEGEERFILMGMSAQLRILVICHCERGSNLIRIISARKANKSERDQYEGCQNA